MKKAYFLGLILIFTLAFLIEIDTSKAAFLDDGSCEVRTFCNLTIFVVNETTGDGHNNAFCNITVNNPNGFRVGEFVMDNISIAGIYSYNITEDSGIGKYTSDCYCQLNPPNGDVTDVADCTYIVGTPQNYNRFLHLLLLIFPISLIALTKLTDIKHFATLGSFLLIIAGIGIFLKLFPFLEFDTSFVAQGFSIILFSLGLYLLGLIIPEYISEVEF